MIQISKVCEIYTISAYTSFLKGKDQCPFSNVAQVCSRVFRNPVS